ncbi:MAG TPA: DMT family transporter [Pelagibacterium sp.]|uniref:DMT family transporter n=1 Tax=Pelagibacterium sp. TaxID=1967288 RepID=UPI002C12E7B7|nr:DMT family transporter [Pelagibacterium sp.]HWJ87858.1 DMT family transporter [Pelagibacterium sp.]
MPPVFSSDRHQLLGLGLACLGAALFATKGIFVKLGLAHGLDAITILAWRMILAVPVFGLVGLTAFRDRRQQRIAIPRRAVLGAIAIGVLGYYGASLLDFLSLDLITAQLNRLVLLTYPFMVLILGALLFGRRLPPLAIGAALLAYAGIALIFAHDLRFEGGSILTGTLLALASALAYATYQLYAKPLIDMLGARLFTAVAMSAAGCVVVVHFLLTHPLAALAVPFDVVVLLLGLAIAATVVPAFAISTAIGLIGAERTAVFGNISPIVTILLAIVILGEHFTAFHGVGTILVISGILLFTRSTTPAGRDRRAGL